MEQSNENPIILLSQVCQKKWGKNIEKDVRNTGTAKEPFVIVHIELPDGTIHSGSGSNKKVAGCAAAMRGLDYLNNLPEVNRRPMFEGNMIAKTGFNQIKFNLKTEYKGYCILVSDCRYKIYSISSSGNRKLLRTSGIYAKRSGKKIKRYESDDIAFQKALLYIDNFLLEASL